MIIQGFLAFTYLLKSGIYILILSKESTFERPVKPYKILLINRNTDIYIHIDQTESWKLIEIIFNQILVKDKILMSTYKHLSNF